MNYQKFICWGDSQTYGARTYGCYPLYLVKYLNKQTNYIWSVINYSTNGHTARDLWFRMNQELLTISDINSACVLIGTNDVGNKTPHKLFGEYYNQIINNLEVFGIKTIHCGEIPPIWPDAHPYFDINSDRRRKIYNRQIKQVVKSSTVAKLVKFPNLQKNHYVDPVHFNEKGNKAIARQFCSSILDEHKN